MGINMTSAIFKEVVTNTLKHVSGLDDYDLGELFFDENISYDAAMKEDSLQIFKNNNIFFSLEDSYGGEGQGDSYWSVYKFVNTENNEDVVYVKFDGWYASYSGSEFSRWFFVEPKEETVINFYEVS